MLLAAIQRVVGLAVRRPLAVLGVAALLSGAGALRMLRLPIESDLAALLPDSYLSVRTLRAVGERVGGFQTLQLLVQGPDFGAVERYAGDLADSLARSELVKLVEYRREQEFFEEHAFLYLELSQLEDIRDRIRRGTDAPGPRRSVFRDVLYGTIDERAERTVRVIDSLLEVQAGARGSGYFLSQDSTVLVLNVFPAGDNSNIAFARALYAEARRIVERSTPSVYHPELFVEYGGNFKNKLDEYDVLMGDVRSTAAIGLSAVLILLLAYFRRLSALVVIGVPLAMSLTWTFGLTELVIGELNTFTVFLFVILFGLGVDFGIHYLARYWELRDAGGSAADAVHGAAATTGRALVTTAGTTAAAFFSLTVADFRGFSQFGFIAGVGIVLALVATLTVAPALLVLGARWRAGVPTGAARDGPRALGPSRRSAAWILVPGLALAAVGVLGASRIEFQYDFSDLRANLPQSIDVKRKLSGIIRESNSPAVALVDGPADAAALERAVERLLTEDETPTVARFRSVRDLLPTDQEAKLAVIADIRSMLTRIGRADLDPAQRAQLNRFVALTEVEPVDVSDLPEQATRRFVDRDGRIGSFVYIYPRVALRDGRQAIAFAEDVGTIHADSGAVFHAANSSTVFADMLVLMRREGGRALATTLGAIVLLVALDQRRLRAAALVLLPLGVGLAWVAALMVLFGIKLNVFNIVAIPSIVGIGVDNGVHLYHRFRSEGPESLRRVLRNTGGAVVASSATTMVGFSGLLVAHHPGLNAVGGLAIMGIGAVMVAALVVLPAVLHLLGPRAVPPEPIATG